MAWMAAAVPVPPAPTMHTSACTVSFGSPSSGMLQMASSAALPAAALVSAPSAGASAAPSLVCCGPQPVSAAPANPAVRMPAPARKERLLRLLVDALMMLLLAFLPCEEVVSGRPPAA